MSYKQFLPLLFLAVASIKLTAQLQPVPSPVIPPVVGTRSITDTNKTAVNKGYPFYAVGLDQFVFEVDSPSGFMYGNGEFYFKARKKWITYSSESAEVFYQLNDVSIREVLVYGLAGIKGSPETVYVKLYTLGPDSLPGELMAKGQISLSEFKKNGDKNQYTSVPLSYGNIYVPNGDVVVSVDYTQVIDDTVAIASTFMHDTTKRIGQYRIVQRIGQFLAGRWYNVDDAVFNRNPHADQDLGIMLVTEKGRVLTNHPLEPAVFTYALKEAEGTIQIVSKLPGDIQYRICNSAGKLLCEGFSTNGLIPLPSHAAGAYVLQCAQQGAVQSVKLMMEGN